MRWLGSNLGQWLIKPYTLSLIVVYLYPASSATLFPNISTARVHPSPVIARLRTSISRHRTGSSSHLRVVHIHPSISDSPLLYPFWYHQPLLCVPLPTLPPPSFLIYFSQGFNKLCLCCLLMPPCVPPASSPLISLLPCAHLQNMMHHHPLCHLPLSYSCVFHFQIGSCRFLHQKRTCLVRTLCIFIQ